MATITYAEVNEDILRTLERPKPAYFLLVAGFAAAGPLPGWSWLALLTLPIAVILAGVVLGGAEGRKLNAVLKRTSQLHLLFGALLAGSFLL